jgi:hypothetical protein
MRSIDTSPADEGIRTPGLPLDWQIRIGTGIQYDWNKDVTKGPTMNIWMRSKQRSIRMAGPSRAPQGRIRYQRNSPFCLQSDPEVLIYYWINKRHSQLSNFGDVGYILQFSFFAYIISTS